MTDQADDKLLFGASDRIELIATIVMALAAILTAWSAFQSAKWSGVQATSFSQAGAARTESTRFDTKAGQQTGIDVAIFTSWLDALNADMSSGAIELTPGTVYEPTEDILSGFLFDRVRDEFRPAFEAWLVEFAEDPETAPPTPFEMDEYVNQNAVEAQRFQDEAEQLAQEAASANQNSDDYVLGTVEFALVIFFAGISSKLVAKRNRYIAISAAIVLFLVGLTAVIGLPRVPIL